MSKYLLVILLTVWIGWGSGVVVAQGWDFDAPKAIVTNDCQHTLIGQIDDMPPLTNKDGYQIGRIKADSYNPKLSIQLFLNGQPNNIEQAEPNGAILISTDYSGTLRETIRKLYYRAPSRMPDKNPVEIKAIITPATGPPITITTQMYVLAERWTFLFFHALRYKCYEGGSSNPRNGMAVDMGAFTGMTQEFHFEAEGVNRFTGEAKAILDGDPEFYFYKKYNDGSCDPANFTANLLWGDDDYTSMKNVKVRFTGRMMKVDYQIDYMNYLGWTLTHHASGKTIPGPTRKPGSHNVQAGFECPLQRQWTSKYRMPPEQQVMLHVASGVQLQANK